MASSVDKTDFSRIFVVMRSAVFVLTSCGYLMRLPPIVSRVQFVSSLCGLMSHTNRPQVTILSLGTSFLVMKSMVLVPVIHPHIPWAR